MGIQYTGTVITPVWHIMFIYLINYSVFNPAAELQFAVVAFFH